MSTPSPVPDPFAEVRGKRMGELNEAQRLLAQELWLREQIGYMQPYYVDHFETLFKVIDGLRAASPANGRKGIRMTVEEAQAAIAELTRERDELAQQRGALLKRVVDLEGAMWQARIAALSASTQAPDGAELRWCVGDTICGRPTATDALEYAEQRLQYPGEMEACRADARLPRMPLVASLVSAASPAVERDALLKLARYGAAMLHAHRGTQACEVGDIDGGTAEDKALACGVLERRTVTEPCGQSCECTDFPGECYFTPDDVRSAIAALANQAPGEPATSTEHEPWVRYNPMTHTYDTRDGTKVAAELVDNVQCLADVLHIARMREKQRSAAPQPPAASPPAQTPSGDSVGADGKRPAAAGAVARWPRTAEHTLRMFRKTQLDLGVPTSKLMPEEFGDAVAWLVLHADIGDEPCSHGIRPPHECKECADEVSDADVAAWMRTQGLSGGGG